LEINLTGTFLCSKYVSKQMIEQGEGGAIIGISSVAAAMGPPGMSAYTASKAGMDALSTVLAAELAPHGITCNIVAPGFIDTAGIDEMRQGDIWERRRQLVPLGGPGKPEECAELVSYLCGSKARWISGQTIYFDGGEIRAAAR
ncbi:MAG: SDR family oxidoreductase, partial [Planctomycetota bacterium]